MRQAHTAILRHANNKCKPVSKLLSFRISIKKNPLEALIRFCNYKIAIQFS